MRIGLFDSGLGGVNVLSRLMKELPENQYVYIGDTPNFPYGNKNIGKIRVITRQHVDTLVGMGVDMIVMACNTASAAVYPIIAIKGISIPILGMVEIGAKEAVKVTKNGKVVVLGTVATAKIGGYTKAIREIDRDVEVREIGCVSLASVISQGYTSGKLVEEILEKELGKVKGFEFDTLVLGCTHYTGIKHSIIYCLLVPGRRSLQVVDPVDYVSKYVKKLIQLPQQ